MKSIRLTLTALILLSLSAVALADTKEASPFARMKSLAGTWEGVITTVPEEPAISGKTMTVTMRVTSMGNTLMHEMTTPSRPDDPITMFYLDGDRLLLTHYCDAGNRPRMVGKVSPDGKRMEFDFLDVEGGTKYGHMHGAKFGFIDENHHTEEWVFMLPGDKVVHAHVDLKRVK